MRAAPEEPAFLKECLHPLIVRPSEILKRVNKGETVPGWALKIASEKTAASVETGTDPDRIYIIRNAQVY